MTKIVNGGKRVKHFLYGKWIVHYSLKAVTGLNFYLLENKVASDAGQYVYVYTKD